VPVVVVRIFFDSMFVSVVAGVVAAVVSFPTGAGAIFELLSVEELDVCVLLLQAMNRHSIIVAINNCNLHLICFMTAGFNEEYYIQAVFQRECHNIHLSI